MAYAKNALITIDNTKVSGSANLTDFPVKIHGTFAGSGTDPDLRITGSGGDIQNEDTTGGNSGALSVPADLAFYDDALQTTQYKHEVEYWDKTTGEFTAFVKIPTLDYNDDTTLYMFYSDSGVTTSQEDITNVWDSNYVGIYHMNNDPASGGTIYDSSSSPANMTSQAFVTAMESADLVSGINGRGITFEKSKEQYLKTATSVAKQNFTTTNYTLEAVFNLGTLTGESALLLMRGDGATYYQYGIEARNTDSKLYMRSSAGGNLASTNAVSTSTNYHVAMVRASTSGEIFKNGSSDGTGTGFNNMSSRTDELFSGYNDYGPAHHNMDATVSELRLSNTNRSSDWIATTYENLLNTSSFYSIVVQTAATGGPPVGMMMGVGT